MMFAVISKGFGTTGIVHETIAEYTDVLSTVTRCSTVNERENKTGQHCISM
jgi:hypothetical protein